MFIRIFGLFALAISLFGTRCWAQVCNGEEPDCFTFDANHPSQTYTFLDGSTVVVSFVKVLTSFDLRLSESHPSDSTCIGEGCGSSIVLDPTVFPPGTVCVKYPTNPSLCDQYDFSGFSAFSSGPHGVPVKNVDYKGLITITYSYRTSSTFQVHSPAFGHAPGDITTFTEDILTSYSTSTICGSACDPTMTGNTPGLSGIIGLDKPGGTDCFVFVSPTEGQIFHVGDEIEVEFRLSTTCGGDPIRDKDARLSLAMTDSSGNFLSIAPLRDKEEGNKFHFDNKEGVNERDLSTEGLAPGRYTITVFSDEFSPQSVDINLIP